jgi:hypothetical protein
VPPATHRQGCGSSASRTIGTSCRRRCGPIEDTYLAADTDGMARIKRLPDGFIIPARPVPASTPPSGPNWVHEIKHDGYRLLAGRDGPTVRFYTRNAYDWTVQLPPIASAAAGGRSGDLPPRNGRANCR